jgi:teichuronic acid exporter
VSTTLALPRIACLNGRFVRNPGALGGAQMAVRVSRLAATLVLTRFLSPNDFGLAAIVLTVYEMVALFTRNGISAMVVRASDEDAAAVAETAYLLNWIVCLSLAAFQVLIAAPIAWLYGNPSLALPIALMAPIYLATPLCNIQCVMMEREGRLGRIALAGGVQVTADNLLTALFAVMGMGRWAIVLPKLLVAPIWVFMTRPGHAWRPARAWWPRGGLPVWREISRFSRGVLGVELLTTAQANIDNLVVGYFLGVEALGIYYFAFNAGLGITLGLVSAFRTAVYPHLCEARPDRALLTRRYHESLRPLGAIVVPMVLLQVLLAPVYVPIVFGEKWIPAIPVLMIVCLSALARPFAGTCSQLLKAVGRPEIELRWQTALTALLIVGLVIGAQMGIAGVAMAVLTVQSTVLLAYCLRAPCPFIGVAR